MTEATRIDGKAFADGLRARIANQVKELKSLHNLTPGLAMVIVGEDPASHVYVRNKNKATTEAGMKSFEHQLPAETSQKELLTLIDGLNNDPAVHGILVQLPLPKQIDEQTVLAKIDPDKDVDGFHVINAGRLATGMPGLVPSTPLGCLMLIQDQLGKDNLAGKHAVVVGRSNIVGKPMAQLLLRENCTVTITHSRTVDLAEECRRADILVCAVGRAQLIQGDWIKPGAIVIDVGISRIAAAEAGGKDRLVGDVDYAGAAQVARAITPVPGGVGPMTIACLLANTVTAACALNDVEVPNV
jgi:methylenetetrahydrofolate dehydrogenase (NADP+)/methenyltetrahydrofolate cyclohydrolase